MTFKPAERQVVADRGSPRFAGKVVLAGDQVSLVRWLDPRPRGPEQYVSNEMLIPILGGEGKMNHKDGEKSDTEAVGDDLNQQTAGEVETGDTEDVTRPDPDFQSLTTVEELIECHNDMVGVAVGVGMKAVTVESFESVEEGQLACERLHQSIKRAQSPEEEKRVKKAKAKKVRKSVKKPTAMAAAPKAAKPAKAAKPKITAKGNGHAKGERVSGELRKGSKTEIIAHLLQRKNGTTTAEILEATGWPAVSVPAMAKAAGLKLQKEKEQGKPTRYYGS